MNKSWDECIEGVSKLLDKFESQREVIYVSELPPVIPSCTPELEVVQVKKCCGGANCFGSRKE